MSRRKHLVEEYFESVSSEEDWSPRYNIAPTQPVPVIRQNPKEPVRELSLMKWGLIPSWAPNPFGRCERDQREVRDSQHETSIPRCAEVSQVPDSSGRFL